MAYIRRITQLTVLPEGEPIFSEHATAITIEDEAGVEFLLLAQSGRESNSIAIAPDEWPVLRAAIDEMIDECRPIR